MKGAKHTKKKAIALLCIAALALSGVLAGCAKEEQTKKTPPTILDLDITAYGNNINSKPTPTVLGITMLVEEEGSEAPKASKDMESLDLEVGDTIFVAAECDKKLRFLARPGTYKVSVISSPINADGTVYEVLDEPFDVRVIDLDGLRTSSSRITFFLPEPVDATSLARILVAFDLLDDKTQAAELTKRATEYAATVLSQEEIANAEAAKQTLAEQVRTQTQ